MKLNQHEIDSLSKLEPFDRYQYFIKRVADNQFFYVLKNNADFALSSIEDYTLFAVWPFEDYANLCKINEWNEYTAFKVDFEKFDEMLAPIILEQNYLINVFPIDNKTGFIVNLDEFIRDLNTELEQY